MVLRSSPGRERKGKEVEGVVLRGGCVLGADALLGTARVVVFALMRVVAPPASASETLVIVAVVIEYLWADRRVVRIWM